MKIRFAIVLLSALTISGCAEPAEQLGTTGGNKKHGIVIEKPFENAVEVARRSGNLIPANPDMIRLMKLPITKDDGTYPCWQLIVEPSPNDVRAIYVGEKDPDIIILGRANTRRGAFEHISYLTTPRGELRCVVYSNYGSKEQEIIEPNDPRYQKAVSDFEDQVSFWRNVKRNSGPRLKKTD